MASKVDKDQKEQAPAEQTSTQETQTHDENKQPQPAAAEKSFAESVMQMGGKSADEARRTGAIDAADEQVETFFAPEYQTANSPIHRAVWQRELPVELFRPQPPEVAEHLQKTMTDSVEVVRRHVEWGTIYDENGKVAPEVLDELGEAGYWGMLVERKYGGQEAPFRVFASFLTKMATVEPTVAGLASVHGCIGAVDPIVTFGNEQQKERFLPKLASGERLSAFALTEPGAGSDLTALKTTAVLDGDDYVVNGEKLFITNAVCGRTIGLVCLIEDRPAVLIVDLPDQENEHFQMVRYKLHALKHAHNNGLKFHDFRVPQENLLEPVRGDGLTIAYHGLNRGRVALCASAAGHMRGLLANMLPWANFRKTYGHAIETRELVRRRISRMAGLIVGCDALVHWCSWLLDEGYRGELECMVAKIFGSEAQKEAAIELFMKTHGGRAFLEGHLFGDEVHEFLAPCIYEGEGEMLGMAFFKSLVKEHGRKYFEPIGRVLHDAGIRKPNLANPAHLWHLKGPLANYGKWWMAQQVGGRKKPHFEGMPRELKAHAEFASAQLAAGRQDLSGIMRKFQLKLPDRQLRIAEISQRMQDMVVMLVTATWAAQQEDEFVRTAADILCQDIQRDFLGQRPSDKYFRTVSEFGAAVAEGGFEAIQGIRQLDILMKYDD